MTAIGDHCNTIRAWLNFDYADSLITSWTRMAEEYVSSILRVKHMIAIDQATLTQSRVFLPLDWLDLDFVRVVGGRPLRFMERDTFYRGDNCGHYTITGNYLVVGDDVQDGLNVEISYYEHVPPLGDDPNWLQQYYSRVYVAATLSAACAYSIEDDRALMWQASVDDLAAKLNEGHATSRSSGSRLVSVRGKRSFG